MVTLRGTPVPPSSDYLQSLLLDYGRKRKAEPQGYLTPRSQSDTESPHHSRRPFTPVPAYHLPTDQLAADVLVQQAGGQGLVGNAFFQGTGLEVLQVAT